jgi:hypothetical protein
MWPSSAATAPIDMLIRELTLTQIFPDAFQDIGKWNLSLK